jgi:hypothetical protein
MQQSLTEFEEGAAFRNHPLISSAHARGENRNVFEAFIRDFVRDLQPKGPVEATLAARAAGLAWRLNRAQKLETDALSVNRGGSGNLMQACMRDAYGQKAIEMISRWEQSIERSLLKTLDALVMRQKRRSSVPANDCEIGAEAAKAIENEVNTAAKAPLKLAVSCS